MSRTLAPWFRELAYPILGASAEYSAALPTLDQLLRVLNRIFLACHEHRDYGSVTRDAQALLAELQREGALDRDQLGARLICHVELYLKAVLWLVKPTVASQLRANRGQYTLAPVLRALDLLSQQELDLSLEQSGTVTEPVRRQLLVAYRSRNELIHNPRDLAPYHRTQLAQAGLTTLLAPLVKHAEALRSALAGVLIWPIPDQGLHAILRITDSERRMHLQRFVARQQYRDRLRELVAGIADSEQGSYLLMIGTEGVGKSALCAKLLSDWPTPQPLGPQLDQVRNLAPWLPTALLVSGKQARQPREIVDLLLAQARTFLEEEAPVAQRAGHPDAPPGTPPSAYHASPHSYEDTEHRDAHSGADLQSPVHLRRALYQALERLKEERGPTLLVIDAIDEISPDGRLLDFLPERLPVGITVLLTARQGVAAIGWVQQNLRTDTWRLDGFERDEIPSLTQVEDTTPAQRRFNDEVLKQTEGLPLLIHAAMRGVREEGGGLTAPLVSTMDAVLMRRIADWQPSASSGPAPQLELLLLLSLFEPVCPLPLEAAQGFLLHSRIDLSLHAIRSLLEPVRDQLVGLENSQIRLNLRLFAEYVRERHCSVRDRRRLLERVTAWLASDEELGEELQARFLYHWGHERTTRDETSRRIVREIPELLARRGAAQTLLRIGAKLSSYSESPEALIEQCLRTAVELGDINAMSWLGDSLLHGELGSEVPETQRQAEGAVLMRRAAEAGHARAMGQLGHHLLRGQGMPADLREGEQWLRKAAAAGDIFSMTKLATQLLTGSASQEAVNEAELWMRRAAEAGESFAMHSLSSRLLDGYQFRANAEEGQKWLRRAAESGDAMAMASLACRLLDGTNFPVNAEEGERWLRKSAEAQEPWSMYELGRRLLMGDKLQVNLEEGERWLRKSASAEEPSAMGALGRALLIGDKLRADREEGERWLRKAAETGNAAEMTQLGQYLLEGKRLARNVEEGERWLRKAAEAGNVRAKAALGSWLFERNSQEEGAKWLRQAGQAGHMEALGELGYYLLEGARQQEDIHEGRRLLYQAAEAGSVRSMGVLGHQLLSGNKLQADEEEGIRWLRKASEAGNAWARGVLGCHLLQSGNAEGEVWLRKAIEVGNTRAMGELGSRLIRGDKLPVNLEEGEMWLRKAVAAGEIDATGVLAESLLEGELPGGEIAEGLQWLRKAAEAGHPVCMKMLARHLLEGDLLPMDVEDGEKWLRKSAEAGHTNAMANLGWRLLRGDKLAVDREEGERWLRKSAETGDPKCMSYFGICLIDGDGLTPDPVEGVTWLRKAAEAGDADAMLLLGQRLAAGKGIPVDVLEAFRWLRKAADAGKVPAMGGMLRSALASLVSAAEQVPVWLSKVVGAGRVSARSLLMNATRLYQQGRRGEAARLLTKGYRAGDIENAVSLAYMVRRGEAASPDGRPLSVLLAAGRERGMPLAHINWALCLAGGVQVPMDWEEADRIIATLSDVDELGWWIDTAAQDDAEGHLVLGWLVRHGRIEDPEGKPFAERLLRARERGWAVPDWLLLPPLQERVP